MSFIKAKKHKKGFTLVELLIALVVFSVSALMLPGAYRQTVKVFKEVKHAVTNAKEHKRLFEYMQKDLQNMVPFKDYPFEGREDSMRFVSLADKQKSDGSVRQPYLISYSIESGQIIRESLELTTSLRKVIHTRILAKDIESFTIYYPYRDIDAPDYFETEWQDKTARKLPRVLKAKLKFTTSNQIYERWVGIEQGTWLAM